MIMEIDIKKIKTYVISMKTEMQRRESMKNVLSEFLNWEFVDALDVRGKFPYWIGCGLSHYMTLQKAQYPCIILEDDIDKTKWYTEKLNFNNDGLLYLGISSWGLKNGSSEHMGSVFEKNDENTCIVKYMTSTHAIYYPSQKIANNFYEEILSHMFQKGRPFDEHYAVKQIENKTYVLKKPIFYQNCPKNNIYTNFELQD